MKHRTADRYSRLLDTKVLTLRYGHLIEVSTRGLRLLQDVACCVYMYLRMYVHTHIRNIHICEATDMSSYQSRKEGDTGKKEWKERRKGRKGIGTATRSSFPAPYFPLCGNDQALSVPIDVGPGNKLCRTQILYRPEISKR